MAISSDWPVVGLGEHIMEVSERKGTRSAVVLSVTNASGFVRSLDVFGKQVFSEDVSNYKLVRLNDLAYNPTRINVGSVALCEIADGGAVSPMYVVVRCRSTLYPKFLYYFLKSELGRQHINHLSVGAVRPQLRFQDLALIELSLPPLTEQKTIADTMDNVVALRRLSDRAADRSRRMPTAVFHEMFPSHDSDVEKAALSDECQYITVGHVGPMSTEYIPTGVPFLRSQNIRRGRVDLTDVMYISEEFHQRLRKSALRPGDVVTVRSGKNTGTAAAVPEGLPVANCADLIIFRPGTHMNSEFLAEYLNQELGDRTEIRNSVGAAQPHFNIGEARRLSVPVIPLSSQEEYAARVQEIRKLQTNQTERGLQLDALLESVLTAGLRGEI